MPPFFVIALLRAARAFILRVPFWRRTNVDTCAAGDLVRGMGKLLPERVDHPALRRQGDAVVCLPSQHRDQVRRSEKTLHDARGIWVRAWLLAKPAPPAFQSDEFLEALDALPHMAREVYRLHRIEGMSGAEIGDQLGLEPGQVDALLFEALRRLHEQLYSRG